MADDSVETDPVMLRVQALLEKSQLTMDELGRRMGYGPSIARKAAWQFVRRTNDPRLSMLRKFAAAVGVEVKELLG